MTHEWDTDCFDANCSLMLDVTLETLRSDQDLRLCEGLRLIDATRTAVERKAPGLLSHFDSRLMPAMREVLMKRFGVEIDPLSGTVN